MGEKYPRWLRDKVLNNINFIFFGYLSATVYLPPQATSTNLESCLWQSICNALMNLIMTLKLKH